MKDEELVLHGLLKMIHTQKRKIRACGYDPTWETFEGTLGWYQLEKKFPPEIQKLYKELWETVP